MLVTGAAGYVGGQLIRRLLEKRHRVRAMARDGGRLRTRLRRHQVEVVEADPLKAETLPPALADIGTAFYLIHSMTGGPGFRQRDITAARHFAQAADAAGVDRIIYLGGLGNPDTDLSEHLQSRHETGCALRESGVPVTELRAAVIVGSGSVSFEMVRNLTERLPVMICPRWVFTKAQPIAIDDVLQYLVAAAEKPEAAGRIIEIGGADALTYGEMMIRYGRLRGLRRMLIPVPVLTPRLSSYWVHWVTPVRAAYARPLIEGLRNEVIVRDTEAATLFPEIHPVDYETAVRTALQELRPEHFVAMMRHWPKPQKDVELTTREGMIVERRHLTIQAPAENVYGVFSSLGGKRGWLCLNWAWRLRGLVDRMVGGVGLRRTRPDRAQLRENDVVDFYRVQAVEENSFLRFHVEMKLPGEGWVQFEAKTVEEGRSELIQTLFFAPRGLLGLAYWYLLYPAHRLVFTCMLQRIARQAQTPRPPNRT